MKKDVPDGSPLAGWVFAFTNGGTLLGRPVIGFDGKTGIIDGLTTRSLLLKPVYAALVQVSSVPVQGPGGQPVIATVTQLAFRSILARNEFDEFPLPVNTSCIPAEKLAGKVRQEIANSLDRYEKDALAQRSGLIMAAG